MDEKKFAKNSLVDKVDNPISQNADSQQNPKEEKYLKYPWQARQRDKPQKKFLKKQVVNPISQNSNNQHSVKVKTENKYPWQKTEQKRTALRKKMTERQCNIQPNQILQCAHFKDLNGWFAYHYGRNNKCDNCPETFFYHNITIAKACQAHILPKKLFPSVSLHKLNHLYLGALAQNCNCHGQFDSSWENAQAMPVFELAIEKFLLFKDCIAPNELQYLPEPFLKYL